WQKRAVLTATVFFLFGMLLLFKYYGFFSDIINPLIRFLHGKRELPGIKFLLPMGISYYTLQAAGYLIDVYRGKYRASEHFGKVALFLCFFPQIVEGPIGRFDQLAEPLYEGHAFDYDRFTQGIQLIVWGLFKKIVIADRANLFVSHVFDNVTDYSGSILLTAGILYTIQIYAEFSACMDIVTGSAQLFGVPLASNFERPFFSKSVAEFWRRWHITLGAWFKDYVFYSLSLSKGFMRLSKFMRKHTGETVASLLPASLALLAVWLGVGFWHGSGWKYVVYGLYYYTIMMVGMFAEPLLAKGFAALSFKRENPLLNGFRMIRTCLFVVFGMMLFRADTVAIWRDMVIRVFTAFDIRTFWATVFTCGMDKHDFLMIAIGVAVMLVISLLQEKGVQVRKTLAARPLPVRWAVYLALVLSIIIFGAYGYGYESVGFIYVQF
ncbi:MAG: MBOAT family protein, partial [Clostridia bacterium]|nr:MBOAT family protein [Clostridia bacterium]